MWWKTNSEQHIEHTIPTVKDGGDSIMLWGCFPLRGHRKAAQIRWKERYETDGCSPSNIATMERFSSEQILVLE